MNLGKERRGSFDIKSSTWIKFHVLEQWSMLMLLIGMVSNLWSNEYYIPKIVNCLLNVDNQILRSFKLEKTSLTPTTYYLEWLSTETILKVWKFNDHPPFEDLCNDNSIVIEAVLCSFLLHEFLDTNIYVWTKILKTN